LKEGILLEDLLAAQVMSYLQPDNLVNDITNVNKSNRSAQKYSSTRTANITKTTFDKTAGEMDKTINSATFKRSSQLSLIANYKKRENIEMR